MAKSSKAPRGGMTPGKSIAIGILAVVLLVVIVMQMGGKKKPVAIQPRSRRASSQRAESNGSPSPTAAPTVPRRSEKSWPAFDVAMVVASNPFILPQELRAGRDILAGSAANPEDGKAVAITRAEVREMRARQAEFLASLRVTGVDMVLRSRHGSVARIGELTLHVGDVHEGLRVESIGPDGVVFVPAEVADGQLK